MGSASRSASSARRSASGSAAQFAAVKARITATVDTRVVIQWLRGGRSEARRPAVRASFRFGLHHSKSVLFLVLAAHRLPLAPKHLSAVRQEHLPRAGKAIAFELGLHSHHSFGLLLTTFHGQRAMLLAESDLKLKQEPILGKRHLGELVAAILPAALVG